MKKPTVRRMWEVLHNAVAHPLMVVLPESLGTWLHDLTADQAFDLTPNVDLKGVSFPLHLRFNEEALMQATREVLGVPVREIVVDPGKHGFYQMFTNPDGQSQDTFVEVGYVLPSGTTGKIRFSCVAQVGPLNEICFRFEGTEE